LAVYPYSRVGIVLQNGSRISIIYAARKSAAITFNIAKNRPCVYMTSIVYFLTWRFVLWRFFLLGVLSGGVFSVAFCPDARPLSVKVK